MSVTLRRAALAREKDDCFFLDDSFETDRQSLQELASGRFVLLRPGQARIASGQISAFGELFRERISFGSAYCDRPHFRGFRIDVDHDSCVVQVTVRIALVPPTRWLHLPGEKWVAACPDRGADACDEEILRRWQEQVEDRKPAWKRVIEDTWSEKFSLVPVPRPTDWWLSPWRDFDVWFRNVGEGAISNCSAYLIRVGVQWVDDDPADPLGGDVTSATWDDRVDYIIQVQWGGGGLVRDAMRYWHLDMHEGSVAHEFGHLLGNPDEYDGTCDGCPDRPIVDGSIMNSLTMWPQGVLAHHFFLVSYWMFSRTCTEYGIVAATPGLRAGIDLGVEVDVLAVDFVRELWKASGISCP
jgi:hypothetical protein